MIDKRWAVLAGIVLSLVLFFILTAPFFVNAETFRPSLESQLSSALGRNITLGKLTFSLFTVSLVAEDVSIADDPAFGTLPFIQANKLDVGVKLLPLLAHQEVRITKLTLETPSIQLIEHVDGKWNFSSLGRPLKAATPDQAVSVPEFSVDELSITDGNAVVSFIPASSKPFEFTAINLSLKQFSFLKAFPFELSAKLPADGTLKLSGEAGPILQADTSRTPFHGTLQIKDFDPVASGVIEQGKGISMDNDVDGQISSDSVTVSSSGKIQTSRLQFAPKGSPAQQPVDIDYSITQNLTTRQGVVSDLAVHGGSSAVHVNGGFQFTADALLLNLHLSAPSVPLEQLDNLLPAVGIHLPGGSSLKGGTLIAEISITGPATATTFTGPIEIDNTLLAGFDLDANIQGMSSVGSTSAGTQIHLLKANVIAPPENTKINDIVCNLPQIGTATGKGEIATSGSLDFNLIAKLNSPNGKVIPISVSGSATSPVIHANLGVTSK